MWLCGCIVSPLRNIQVVNGCSRRSVVVGKRAPTHGPSSASRSTLRAHHNIIQQHVSRFSIQESGEAISTQFPDLSPSFSGSPLRHGGFPVPPVAPGPAGPAEPLPRLAVLRHARRLQRHGTRPQRHSAGGEGTLPDAGEATWWNFG